jgi:hypothetical protein
VEGRFSRLRLLSGVDLTVVLGFVVDGRNVSDAAVVAAPSIHEVGSRATFKEVIASTALQFRQRLSDWVAAYGTRLDRDRPTRQTSWPGEEPTELVEDTIITHRLRDPPALYSTAESAARYWLFTVRSKHTVRTHRC